MNINTNISQATTKNHGIYNDAVSNSFSVQSSCTTSDISPNDIVHSPIDSVLKQNEKRYGNEKRDIHENVHNIDIDNDNEKIESVKSNKINLTLDEKLANFRKKNGIFEPSSY
jgi:hypothetical protein